MKNMKSFLFLFIFYFNFNPSFLNSQIIDESNNIVEDDLLSYVEDFIDLPKVMGLHGNYLEKPLWMNIKLLMRMEMNGLE